MSTKNPRWKAHPWFDADGKTIVGWRICPDQLDAMVERMAAKMLGVTARDWKRVALDVQADFLVKARTALRSIGIAQVEKEKQT
jgi:hypothetical protein